MLTFAEFLKEARHQIEYYKQWGVIAPDGKFVDGPSHPRARQHSELINMHSRETGQNRKHYVQYANLDYGSYGGTIIRGDANKPTVQSAIKHFDNLPHHPSGSVMAEFGERSKTPHHIIADDHKTAKTKLRGLARMIGA